MGFASEFGHVANQVESRIAPVNYVTWALLPAFFGVILVFIILLIWRPKFTGTYNYRSCNGDKNDSGRTCQDRVGQNSIKNTIIILIMFLAIPSVFAGIGYKVGFFINNPRLGSGIWATQQIGQAFN